MRYEDENIWLTQKMMATLYDVELSTINEHIKKVFNDSELEEKATIRKFRIVQTEGSRQVEREINHYNLQMIIAVGYDSAVLLDPLTSDSDKRNWFDIEKFLNHNLILRPDDEYIVIEVNEG